ncbi:antirestriction protein ArdA [Actinomyces sp. 565]|uniref:antirestriction protein ArdA n=1 Tax=Actinomyces sp. 565 TaxID=2057794 RepID=UPI0013A6C3BB|nr:antirestriction protein ArdA [Actinomyces sp. 565]NDR52725.1 antirestriction protein ArdA [Actinomyces sp. 565]
MSATTTKAPSVWLGCLSCYMEGRLVGRWVPALGCGALTPADLHDGEPTTHDEVIVFDYEGLPSFGHLTPGAAGRWGERYAEVGPGRWGEYIAWVEATGVCQDGEPPSKAAFDECSCGAWESFDAFALAYAHDGPLAGAGREWSAYFDLDQWTRDLAYDYDVTNAPGGGVYVFRSL